MSWPCVVLLTPMKKVKSYLNWSSGKDAMLALHYVLESGNFSVEKLITTVNTTYGRVSMHGIRWEILQKQAQALGVPLHVIELNEQVSLPEYNRVMEKQIQVLKNEGFTHTVFGDIFLEDLKKYREEQLVRVGITPVFPLWKKDTKILLRQFIDLGYRAVVVCTNAKKLDKSFCGKIIDTDFIKDLPADVDPCGENGEFHTFVFDGPLFANPVDFQLGKKVLSDFTPSEDDDCFTEEQPWDYKFWYQDLMDSTT